ncbi:MAG: hypothetical protein ACI90V_000306 [Bacillariaceae sp.]
MRGIVFFLRVHLCDNSIICSHSFRHYYNIITLHTSLQIYKTTAMFEIQFTTENEFSTEDIYHIEEASSLYLNELLTNEESLPFVEQPDSIIDVTVEVQSQEVNGNEISLDSEVTVIHYGNVGIIDLAALFTFLVNRNNTDSRFIYLDYLFQPDATIELISFDFVSESIAMASNITATSDMDMQNSKYSGNEKTLLIVTTFLSITLFGMSAILIWVGGGWLMLRKKVQVLLLRDEELTRMTQNHHQQNHHQRGGIQSKPTAETEGGDEEDPDNSRSNESQSHLTNPSGMLGVNDHRDNGSSEKGPISVYGLGVRTPAKIGDTSDDFDTPMSVMSTYSSYSDTGRAPMGIMSMRKLVPSTQFLESQHDQDQDSDSDHDQNETMEVEQSFAGMKKLEY